MTQEIPKSIEGTVTALRKCQDKESALIFLRRPGNALRINRGSRERLAEYIRENPAAFNRGVAYAANVWLCNPS